jgi:hypothetical protein
MARVGVVAKSLAKVGGNKHRCARTLCKHACAHAQIDHAGSTGITTASLDGHKASATLTPALAISADARSKRAPAAPDFPARSLAAVSAHIYGVSLKARSAQRCSAAHFLH